MLGGWFAAAFNGLAAIGFFLAAWYTNDQGYAVLAAGFFLGSAGSLVVTLSALHLEDYREGCRRHGGKAEYLAFKKAEKARRKMQRQRVRETNKEQRERERRKLDVYIDRNRGSRIGGSRYECEQEEYRHFLCIALRQIEWCGNSGDYIAFYLDLLRKELGYSCLLEINRGGEWNRYGYPFYSWMDSDLLGYASPGAREEDKVEIDLEKDCVLAQPWKHGSYRGHLAARREKPFEYSVNHYAEFYDGLGITSVFAGMHSVAATRYWQKEGKIKAVYYDVTKIFDAVWVRHDLAFCYNREKATENHEKAGAPYSKKHLDELLDTRYYGTDYRLILIYQLAKIQHEIEQGTYRPANYL